MLFVAWGCGCGDAIDRYVNVGGRCVVILGEGDGGCTLSYDYMKYKEGWEVSGYHAVPSGATGFMHDRITVSKRAL